MRRNLVGGEKTLNVIVTHILKLVVVKYNIICLAEIVIVIILIKSIVTKVIR